MGRAFAGGHSRWRTRAHQVLLVAIAGGLVTAFAAPSAATTQASAAVIPAGPVRQPALRLAQAPADLRSAVLRALHQRSLGAAGPDIEPGPISDYLGWSVALSGQTAVVGAPGVHNVAGAAYVYVRAGKGWKLQAALTDPGNIPYAWFGITVALSGSTLLVGSTGWDTYSGRAYVYIRAGTSWHLQARLNDPQGNINDSFGYSVALAGSTALIGTYGGAAVPGTAFVFHESAGRWSRQATLADPGDVDGDDFGKSVALSASAAVIGAPGTGGGAGAAYVYEQSGDAWNLASSLADPGESASDAFGTVAVSGTTVLVGAPGSGASGSTAGPGAAYVYVPGQVSWELQATLASPAGAGSLFGAAVGISGTTAVVGADSSHSGEGTAYIYGQAGSGWERQASLRSSPSFKGDFGSAVAASGSTVFVGAVFDNFSGGAAFAYARSGTRWTSQDTLVNPRGYQRAELGAAVAVAGRTAVVGAWDASEAHGAAYIDGITAGRLSRQVTFVDPDEQIFDYFGQAVAVSGSTALIGSGDADAVYVYAKSGQHWHYQDTITGPGSGGFGVSIALSDHVAVIGAPSSNNGDGLVYVYVRSGSRWHKQATITGPQGARSYFGEAVALAGSTLIVGASTMNYFRGAAYIYARSGALWHLQASLRDPDNQPNDNFGTSVTVSGATALVGAPGSHGFQGTSYVYSRAGAKWRRQAALTVAPTDNPAGGFGGAVALSGDGTAAMALISGVSISGLTTASRMCGHAFEFTITARHWRVRHIFTDPVCNPYDEFGYALAVSGTTALIGSPGSADNAGSATVVTLLRPQVSHSRKHPAMGSHSEIVPGARLSHMAFPS
jgi:FG-GAP repeat protein